MKHKILLILFLFIPTLFFAQKRKHQPKKKTPIEMLAGEVSLREKFPDYIFANDSLMVTFLHEGSKMTCDSAKFNQKEQFFEAFGHVKVNMGDTVFMNSDYMNYSGKTRLSESRGNVMLKNKRMTLTTQKLMYDRNTSQAWYDDWGTVKDEDNTMVSKQGRYFANEYRAEFTQDVTVATNVNNKKGKGNYVVKSNHLNYYSKTKDVEVLGPTTITNNDNPEDTFYTERGMYNTSTMISTSTQKGKISYNGNHLVGDRLFYNQKIGYGNAEGNVVVTRPKDEMVMRGGQAEYYRSTLPGVAYDSVYVTKRAWVSKKQDNDSVYFHAKRITGVNHIDKTYTIIGYDKARMYHKDGQARADSLIYHDKSGTLELYKDPVLWYGNSQITGDTILVYSKKQKIDSAVVKLNALALQKVDSITIKDFNQIKGRFMYATFRDKGNNIDFVHVEGNAQSLFYADENKKGQPTNRIGINRSDCAFINALIENKKLNEVSCMGGTKSILSPEDMMEEDEKYLKGFLWRDKERFVDKKAFLEFIRREEVYPTISPPTQPIKINQPTVVPAQEDEPKGRTDVGKEEETPLETEEVKPKPTP